MKLLDTFLLLILALIMTNCSGKKETEFKWQTDQFADIRILRYQVPGFEELSLKEKQLSYYLSQAALSGRDITWDQNYKHNLYIRDVLENIVKTFSGNKKTSEYENFMVYVKRVWFANGIHHHYSEKKFEPGFSFEYFTEIVNHSDAAGFPLEDGQTVEDMLAKLQPIMFDPTVDPIRTNSDPNVDVVKESAINFYEGLTRAEVEAYNKTIVDKNDPTPISYGLNSKLVKEDGKVVEKVWKSGGMYSGAIDKIVYWLEKAVTVAENDTQKKWLELLADYYKTGNLRTFDQYNILWATDTESRIDAVNGFIETYGDPLGARANWESIISFKDLEATKRVEAITGAAQWFEDNSSIMDEHKREKVQGVSGKVITVVANAGDAYPNSPLGINLPNANWIRANHGSKSVTLGNISYAYEMAGASSGMVEEYHYGEDVINRIKTYGGLSGNLHTDLHEVIGHGSGKINPGVGTPAETMKQYASTLEETRADLVALYYLMDQKLVDLGLIPSLDVGKAEYDNQVTNGLMRQLVRIKLGDDIAQAHMRNRQLIAKWAMDMGKEDKVIEKVVMDGKTFFVINDYMKLREIYGEQLREVQRIKSEGDFEKCQYLVETFGVKIDYDLHKEVLERYAKLNIAPYGGFMTTILEPEMKGDEIIDVKVRIPEDFVEQSLYLSKEYSFLPNYN